jgi:hypothetical protein
MGREETHSDMELLLAAKGEGKPQMAMTESPPPSRASASGHSQWPSSATASEYIPYAPVTRESPSPYQTGFASPSPYGQAPGDQEDTSLKYTS